MSPGPGEAPLTPMFSQVKQPPYYLSVLAFCRQGRTQSRLFFLLCQSIRNLLQVLRMNGPGFARNGSA